MTRSGKPKQTLSIRGPLRGALLVFAGFLTFIVASLVFEEALSPIYALGIFVGALLAGSLVLAQFIHHITGRRVQTLIDQSSALFDQHDEVHQGEDLDRLAGAFNAIAEDLAGARNGLSKEEISAQALLENTVDAIVSINANGLIIRANAATETLFGYQAADLIGKNVRMLAAGTDRLHHDHYIQGHMETGEHKIIGRPREVQGQRIDGSTFPVDLSVARMEAEGETHFIGVMRDLTDRVALEDQLRQAQKMEAVGQLTGGVAHDFNNLLAVVRGNLEMLRGDMRSEGPLNREELIELCTESLHASERGAELTQGLLAFSRKQTLKPEPFDVNETITRMENLLRRTLGETVDLRIARKNGGWLAEADPSQLESAVLNLAVNASDAMNHNGTLTIETSDATLDQRYAATHEEVEAGDYILIAVSDNGQGMDEETLSHVLEPFFTTKEVGEGTGLGLSMIYGYAKQSRGHLSIYSEEGVGTTVKLYLPRSRTKANIDPSTDAQAANVDGSEVILLVEDDAALRRTVTRILKRSGYNVLVAEDGHKALALLDTSDHVDLILSDVILPGGMTGPEIVREAQKTHEDIHILLMSGYTREAIRHRGDISDDTRLIHKPFSPQDLGVALREIFGEG